MVKNKGFGFAHRTIELVQDIFVCQSFEYPAQSKVGIWTGNWTDLAIDGQPSHPQNTLKQSVVDRGSYHGNGRLDKSHEVTMKLHDITMET